MKRISTLKSLISFFPHFFVKKIYICQSITGFTVLLPCHFIRFFFFLSQLSTSFCRHDLIGVFSTTINELKSTPGITYEVRLLQINKLIFCKDRNTGYNVRKNDTQDLSRTDGFKYSFFDRVVDE